jgi:hypothetical protein
MGIGAGIFLIVVGAILSFAVSDHVSGVNLVVIGYICMAAGALALILAVVFNAQRSNTSHREVVERREVPPAQPVVQQPVVQHEVVERRDVPPAV